MHSTWVDIGNIVPNPYQTRLVEDPQHIRALAESILADGLLQPPVGRRLPENPGVIQLAAGHSRVAALRLLLSDESISGFPLEERVSCWQMVQVMVREMSDEEMFRVAVAENMRRRDISVIEEARAMDLYRRTFSRTSEQIGELFGVSGATVRGKLRLLALPEDMQESIARGELNEAAARQMLSASRLTDNPSALQRVAQAIRSSASATSWEVEQELRKLGVRIQILPLDEVIPVSAEVTPEQLREFGDAAEVAYSHLRNPPACRQCPYRAGALCGKPSCYSRKSAAWADAQFAAVVERMGLPIWMGNPLANEGGAWAIVAYENSPEWWDALKALETGDTSGLWLKRVLPDYPNPKTLTESPYAVIISTRPIVSEQARKADEADARRKLGEQEAESRTLLTKALTEALTDALAAWLSALPAHQSRLVLLGAGMDEGVEMRTLAGRILEDYRFRQAMGNYAHQLQTGKIISRLRRFGVVFPNEADLRAMAQGGGGL